MYIDHALLNGEKLEKVPSCADRIPQPGEEVKIGDTVYVVQNRPIRNERRSLGASAIQAWVSTVTVDVPQKQESKKKVLKG